MYQVCLTYMCLCSLTGVTLLPIPYSKLAKGTDGASLLPVERVCTLSMKSLAHGEETGNQASEPSGGMNGSGSHQ